MIDEKVAGEQEIKDNTSFKQEFHPHQQTEPVIYHKGEKIPNMDSEREDYSDVEI